MTSLDLTAFLADGKDTHSAFIICPGGGYWRYGPQECEPVALWLNSIGISAFLLKYSLMPERHPAPLADLQSAIRTLRASADEYNIDPLRVGVIGFSAGAHLASTAATRFDYGDPAADNPIERHSSRPDLIILSYPVISFEEYTHEGTVHNLLGDEPDQQLREGLSNHKQVTSETPAAFIWQTADDPVVPVENSLLFASALSHNNVPFELHVFPHGPHGSGLAIDFPAVAQWTDLAEIWLRSKGF